MNVSTEGLPGRSGARNAATRAAVAIVALLLGACGSGSSTATTGPDPLASCDPADAATAPECGSVIVTVTDADGDFLNYTVDVLSLTLETANGRVVETLPRETRINFTDYVELTELVAVASVPPATYVAGTIHFDYTDAEVFVAVGDGSKAAVVTDQAGSPLEQAELRIRLSNRDQLTVRRGLQALLQLDFDLAASHVVDIVPTPATTVAEPFIVAELTPVDEKETRVRGPLLEVDQAAGEYIIALRPFHHRDGDFGRMALQTNDDTEFEINDESYFGAAGLQALAAAGRGTPTVAGGTLDVAERQFTAAIVLAGSSVPGEGRDAVVGNVIARDGNNLTVRGATIIPHDRRAHFHDDVLVQVGAGTKVFKDGDRLADPGIEAISVGQRVTIRGSGPGALPAATDADSPQILFDATQGAVRMHVTHLSGIVNATLPGQVDIALQAIDRRRADIFDFSGTGISPDLDADPGNYEVATGNLTLADFSAGKPIAVRGFPEAFGVAPPDFNGRTVIDFTEVRSALGIGWGTDGTTAPFLSMGEEGLVLDNQNSAIDARHYIKQGTVLIDLTALESGTTIVPPGTGRTLYVIKTAESLRQYSDFADFAGHLVASLDGVTSARSMFARGQYDVDSNVFTAFKLGVYLLEP
jgi:hypothetical protein